MKINKKIVGVIVFLLISAAAVYYFFFSPYTKPAIAEIPTFKVERGELIVSISGTGAVTTSVKDDITAKKAGVIRTIYKNEFDKVKAGDLILELKDDDINITIEDTTMNIKNIERDLANRIKEKENQMVRAPADGVITNISVEEGDVIKSSTIIANISNYSKYSLVVPVASTQIKSVKKGQIASVFLPEYMSEVEGIVTGVANFSRPGPGGKIYYDVELEVSNPGGIKADSKASAVIVANGEEIISQETGKLTIFQRATVKYETTRAVTVKDILVEENDFVKKGQLLMELNDENFNNDIENLNSRLFKAQLQLQNLMNQKAALKIYATIDGTISRQRVNIEDGVNMGGVVSTISDYNQMEFTIPVDELDISKIQLGMAVNVTVDALPGKAYKGQVSEIANEGVAQNGVATYQVTVKILDPKGLKVGMSANAQIVLKQKNDTLMLRMAAVQQYNKAYYVVPRILNGKEQEMANPKKERIPVEVGINNKDFIEIISGLNEGDEVYSPRPSTKATPKPAGAAPLNNIISK